MAEDKQKYELKSNPGAYENLNYGFPSEGDEWSSDYFVGHLDALNDLQQIDVSTTEGLGKFYEIVTDPSVKQLNPQQTSKAKDNLVSLVNSALMEKTVSNAGGLTGMLDKSTSGSLALSFQGFYDGNSGEAYKNAATAITHAQNVAQDIKQDKQAYFEKKLEGLDDLSKTYWSMLANEIIEADMTLARSRAIESLDGVGSPQAYLAENIVTAKRLADSYQAATRELQEEKQKAYQGKAEELGRMPTAYELAEVDGTFKEKEKEFGEKYKMEVQAAQAFPKMLGETMNLAYASYKQQQEDAKNNGSNGEEGSE